MRKREGEHGTIDLSFCKLISVDQVPLLSNISDSLATRAVIDRYFAFYPLFKKKIIAERTQHRSSSVVIFSSGHFLIGALSWALAIQSHPFRQIFKGKILV
jgi:hypothetical protein